MNISVDLDRDTMDAIKTVRVSDDGHGISPDEVEATFGYLLKSWKAMKDKTKNGKRQLHGRHGDGPERCN